VVKVDSPNSNDEYDEDYFHRNKSDIDILKDDIGGYSDMSKFDDLKYYKWKIDLIRKHEKNGSVLDIGCAFGYFLKFLGEGFDRYGCDVSSFAISKAKENSDINFAVADISKEIPFKRKFDFITSFDVFEHIEDIDSAFLNIKKMLKEDGRLYMMVPVKSKIQKLIHKSIGISVLYNDPSHKHFMKPKEWEKKIENYFEVIETVPITFENFRIKHLPFWSFFVLENK